MQRASLLSFFILLRLLDMKIPRVKVSNIISLVSFGAAGPLFELELISLYYFMNCLDLKDKAHINILM